MPRCNLTAYIITWNETPILCAVRDFRPGYLILPRATYGVEIGVARTMSNNDGCKKKEIIPKIEEQKTKRKEPFWRDTSRE